MQEKALPRVSHPPSKPLMIWDGQCHFCRHWIERWQVVTNGQVDYATSQKVAGQFPEIPRAQFERSVVLIDCDGNVFTAAEAVYRSLSCRSSKRWLSWSYEHVPGFAAISEFAYKMIAGNRTVGSFITRALWGEDVSPPTYFGARRWFLRGLGLVYFIAFVSLWIQIDGLVGANGISPVSEFLPAARDQLGPRAFFLLPTLCWLGSSNACLHFLCGGGAFLSLLLIAGIGPVFSLIGLFVLYLSLAVAGQTFLSFQWDILLLETGFVSIFLAPWQLWFKRSEDPPVSRIGLFLLKLLLFKLMLMSGVVKLTSGDDSWWNLTALDYHYWSQPLPTVFSWWVNQAPEWFAKFSVAFCLIVEIVVPFLIWAPRRPRLVAAGFLIFLQIAIAVTGNYCFFNLLTIVLCFLLIDDSVWRRRRGVFHSGAATGRSSLLQQLSTCAAVLVLIITLPLNAWLIYIAFRPAAEWPRALTAVFGVIEPFRIINSYGLFRVMTKDRREIVMEGSADGIDWTPYEFRWKPGDLNRAPGWCAPHQPRLDWQMWFAALGSPRQNPWFVRFAYCLLENKREVVGLLERNPFPNAPPRFVRATFYRYRFTTGAERSQSGDWWKRQELGEYLQTLSLR